MGKIQKNKYSILGIISKYSFILVILFILILPSLLFQENVSKVYAKTVNIGGTGIENPLPGIDDIPSFIVKIINGVLFVGIPIITLAIIYSGFLFVAAQGNPEKINKAKEALIYTIVGAAILLGSFLIANAIKGTVDVIKDENV